MHGVSLAIVRSIRERQYYTLNLRKERAAALSIEGFSKWVTVLGQADHLIIPIRSLNYNNPLRLILTQIASNSYAPVMMSFPS